jgi:hypothetical protein
VDVVNISLFVHKAAKETYHGVNISFIRQTVSHRSKGIAIVNQGWLKTVAAVNINASCLFSRLSETGLKV